MGKQWKQCQTLFFWAPKITADGDCSHEIKRRLLLGRKVMTNLDSIFKSRDITLPTKVRLVKALVFPAVMYGCESWTVKKAECQRIDAFELWCWRRLLRVPWTARSSNQSILKETGPGCSLNWTEEHRGVTAVTGELSSYSVQFNSVAQSCPTLCGPMNHSTPGLPVHHQLPDSLKLMSIESVMPSSHLILCHPLLLLPTIPPNIRVFSNESTLRMRWPKYWSFSFSISPSYEHPELISFRMDWCDLLAVQGTLKSLLQHHSSKASILQCSAFFTVLLKDY